MLEELRAMEDVEILSEPYAYSFDSEGFLSDFV